MTSAAGANSPAATGVLHRTAPPQISGKTSTVCPGSCARVQPGGIYRCAVDRPELCRARSVAGSRLRLPCPSEAPAPACADSCPQRPSLKPAHRRHGPVSMPIEVRYSFFRRRSEPDPVLTQELLFLAPVEPPVRHGAFPPVRNSPPVIATAPAWVQQPVQREARWARRRELFRPSW